MLCETAARAAELLALDVRDLDLPNRRPRVRRKGGAVDWIIWQTGAVRSPRWWPCRGNGRFPYTDDRRREESGLSTGVLIRTTPRNRH